MSSLSIVETRGLRTILTGVFHIYSPVLRGERGRIVSNRTQVVGMDSDMIFARERMYVKG